MSQSMSLLSPLYQHASSPQAEQRCIVLQVTHCVSLSHQLSHGLMWFLHLFSFCLTELKNLAGYSRVSLNTTDAVLEL